MGRDYYISYEQASALIGHQTNHKTNMFVSFITIGLRLHFHGDTMFLLIFEQCIPRPEFTSAVSIYQQ